MWCLPLWIWIASLSVTFACSIHSPEIVMILFSGREENNRKEDGSSLKSEARSYTLTRKPTPRDRPKGNETMHLYQNILGISIAV